MSSRTSAPPASPPLPAGFLAWQVELRRHTARERSGAPHAGVAPLLIVKRPGMPLGVSAHSIICGILPRAERLAEKTAEFRAIYEAGVASGPRTIYDRGLAYLRDYYLAAEDFDAASLSTLLGADSSLALALRAEPRCELVFYVFDLADKTEIGRFRCIQVSCRAEVLAAGPVFDNVWWHNTLFHGKAGHSVVVHFHHEASHGTAFGAFERLAAD